VAGSYGHCVDDQGKLLANDQLQSMLDCSSGDVYEAIQELYGMIWWLAAQLERYAGIPAVASVDLARQDYEGGLRVSPGTNG